MSNASECLANLPLFKCDTCKNETIFKHQCTDCAAEEDRVIEIQGINLALEDISVEIKALVSKQDELRKRLALISK